MLCHVFPQPFQEARVRSVAQETKLAQSRFLHQLGNQTIMDRQQELEQNDKENADVMIEIDF